MARAGGSQRRRARRVRATLKGMAAEMAGEERSSGWPTPLTLPKLAAASARPTTAVAAAHSAARACYYSCSPRPASLRAATARRDRRVADVLEVPASVTPG